MNLSDISLPTIYKDFLPYFRSDNLFHLLPKVAILNSDKEFGLMKRYTIDIALDKLVFQWNNKEKYNRDEWSDIISTLLLGVGFLKRKLPPKTLDEYISLMVANELCMAYKRLERILAYHIYTGTTKHNTEDVLLKEFDGLDEFCQTKIETTRGNLMSTLIKQAKTMLKNNIDFVICMQPHLAKILGLGDTFPLRFDLTNKKIDAKIIVDFGVPVDTLGNNEYREYIYFVPLAIDMDIITRLEHKDQNQKNHIGGYYYFTTDNGLLDWMIERQKWDLQAQVATEMLLSVDRPDLITRIEFTHKPLPASEKINSEELSKWI